MTEFRFNPEQAPFSPQPTPRRKPSSHGKKAALAGFLSLLIPGMGQLYDRRPRKALWLALTIPILLVLAAQTRVLFSFFTMVAFFTILIVWRLFIAADAGYSAWALEKTEAALPRPRLTYPLVAAVLMVAALYPSPEEFKRWTSFAAFKVPSASMCPTICSGERIIADVGAYKSKSPQRGDLVLLAHKSSTALFIKRVIGIPGDIVEPGPAGNILVNGKLPIRPDVCGSPLQKKSDPADYSTFKSTRVPEGTFFVVGDNLDISFDSRTPEFGPVVSDQLRGKPLFLYWSPGRSRIGCPTR